MSGPLCAASACSQYWSRSIEKLTHRPPWPLTLRATSVSGPITARSSRLTRRVKRSTSKGSILSAGSRGVTRIEPCWPMPLTRATRLMPSACLSAPRVRFTRPAICAASCTARGSNSSARRVCTQAKTPPASRIASRQNVRQNRLNAIV